MRDYLNLIVKVIIGAIVGAGVAFVATNILLMGFILIFGFLTSFS